MAATKLLKPATALAACMAAASASALPLDTLYFTQFAGWDSSLGGSTFNPGTTGLTGLDFANPVAGAPAGAVSDMNWNAFSNGNESAINISTFDDASTLIRLNSDLTGADATPGEWNEGDWWVISTLLQTNEVLNSDPAWNGVAPDPLWVADTLANLSIFTDAGHTDVLGQDLDSVTTISFFESRNFANPANCTGENPLGTGCDDVFTIDALDFAPIQFNRDGYQYTFNFTLVPGISTPSGLTALVCPSPDPRCAGVTVPEGTIQVFTPEDAPGTSSIHVAMSFDVRAVPAPGVLGLLGAGALFAGVASRRARRK